MTYVQPYRIKTIETTRKKKPMNSRARCSVCKSYVPQDEIFFANRMSKVCSSECFGTLMGKQRAAKKTAAAKKTPARRRLQPVIPIETRAQIHTRDHGLCRCCGARGTQCHHIQYRSQGGDESLANLILLCSDCHMTKAHGDQSRRYRELFRAYVWLRMVEGRSVFVRDLERGRAVPQVETEPRLRAAS